MFKVIIWNNLQQDFIDYREDNKVVVFDDEGAAMNKAVEVGGQKNQPTKVEYVRRQFTDQRIRRGARSGRIKRYAAVQMTNAVGVKIDGDWVRIAAVFDAEGKQIKRESK